MIGKKPSKPNYKMNIKRDKSGSIVGVQYSPSSMSKEKAESSWERSKKRIKEKKGDGRGYGSRQNWSRSKKRIKEKKDDGRGY